MSSLTFHPNYLFVSIFQLMKDAPIFHDFLHFDIIMVFVLWFSPSLYVIYTLMEAEIVTLCEHMSIILPQC